MNSRNLILAWFGLIRGPFLVNADWFLIGSGCLMAYELDLQNESWTEVSRIHMKHQRAMRVRTIKRESWSSTVSIFSCYQQQLSL